MKVSKESLMSALEAAIKSRENIERQSYGFTKDSFMLGQWKNAYKALYNGEELEIVAEGEETTP